MAGLTGGPACQSCGSPMMSAREHGGGKESNPYCSLCSDDRCFSLESSWATRSVILSARKTDTHIRSRPA